MVRAKRILCAVFIAVIVVGFSPRAGAQLSSLAFLSETSTVTEKPRIIVEECTVEGGGLTSGAICEVSITLRNTSASTIVSSVLVTGRWSSDNPPPVSFELSNQAYVSSIGPMQTRNVVFSLKVKPVNIWAMDSVPLYLDIAYSFDESLDNSNTVLLQLPIGDDQSSQSELSENDSPVDTGFVAGLPFYDHLQYVFAGGSALFALAAVVLILLRFRRK